MKPELQNAVKHCDWFKSWPEENISLAKKFIEQQDPDDIMMDAEEYPLLAFLTVWGDSECIHEEDSHTNVITDFAENSFGLFKPTEIKETWDDNEVNLSFKIEEQLLELNLTIDSDYIAGEVYDIIEQGIQLVHPDITLYCPDSLLGQEYAFLFAHKDSVATAILKGYLPKDELADLANLIEGDEDDEIPDGTGEYDKDEAEFIAEMTLGFDAKPVFYSVYYGDIDSVRKYLDEGGDINVVDPEEGCNLCFHSLAGRYACNAVDSKDIAIMLIEKGIDVSDFSEDGPLYAATMYDDLDVFKIIYEKHSKDINIDDYIELAEENNRSKVLEFLKSC